MADKEAAAPMEEKREAANSVSEVDEKGRAIVCTTSLERAELKQEQIHAYGPDKLIPRCKGSMTAVLQPAE